MSVQICEVGPRDGLQNEVAILPVELRIELAHRLGRTGVDRIEVASFVSPARVPQMAGAEEIAGAIQRADGVVYAALVLNRRGYDRFAETGLDEVHFALAVTDTFNRRNAGAAVEESLAVATEVCACAHRQGRRTSVTFGASFGCPFEGHVDPGGVIELAARLVAAGADEIVFADTIGVAVPRQVRDVIRRAVLLGVPVGVHLHDTRNTGLSNACAALEAGATVFEASIGGIGGCPFAPGATGNIATEDLAYLLDGEGVQTNLDIEALIETAEWLEEILGRPLPGRVHRAGLFVPTGA